MTPKDPTAKTGNDPADPATYQPCCQTCDQAAREGADPITQLVRPFIVCPTCGNKRCPKATLHTRTCSNSNAPGQPGSIYPAH